jgi:hypothetical protein
MDELNNRFERFIMFLQDKINDPDNEYIKNLKNMQSYTFILGLKIRLKELELDSIEDDIEIVDKAFDKIIEKTNFNIDSFDKDDIDKFKLYLKYFYQISKIIN